MSIVIEPEKRLFVDYISEDSATTVNVFIVFIMVKNNVKFHSFCSDISLEGLKIIFFSFLYFMVKMSKLPFIPNPNKNC